MSERCYQCFRPMSLCFCKAIPRIANRTDVLILQHVGERSHAFNTARIVQKALSRCRLITDHNQRFGTSELPIHNSAGLLYPTAYARPLAELTTRERPAQLVIIDGTWSQSKTILRDVAQLRSLPCYRLSPAFPGQYRIRREPDARSLSTLEATVAALRALEPETSGLDQLSNAFKLMVETQLEQTVERAARPRHQSRRTGIRHVPDALLQDPNRLIVAYGEATPGDARHDRSIPLPVNWVAHRLGTSERFSCCLQQRRPLSDAAFYHMRLTAADIAGAVSEHEFCRRWSEFLSPRDVLIVYHQRTYQLLQNVAAPQPRPLVLKSIFRNWHAGLQSQEQIVAAEGLQVSSTEDQSRACQRMKMSLALVRHLRSRSNV